MKNRKFIVVAFVMIACLVVGVGFAELTDTLTIIGNAVIDMEQAETNYEARVFFSDIQFKQHGSGLSTGDTSSGVGTDDATFAIHSLATKGEKVVIELTVSNESNVPVEVTIPETKLSGDPNPSNSNSTYFNVSYAYSIANKIIPSHGTMVITVTIEVISPVTEQTGATFGLELKATTVGADTP